MRRKQIEDWPKRNRHLSREEIAFARVGFNTGRNALDVARDLECSGRVIAKYYAQFRGNPNRCRKADYSRPEVDTPTPRAPVDRASRFYKGNFEL
jgi:hypothetical protein